MGELLSLRYLDDHKQTGVVDFDPTIDKGLTNRWGSEIDSQRFDASLKLGYVFPLINLSKFWFSSGL